VSEGSREEGKGRAKEERKKELERRILVNKVSTGSMGKFDKKLEGEPKIKGAKRKVRSCILDRSPPPPHRIKLTLVPFVCPSHPV
jgi:hypothetical protein